MECARGSRQQDKETKPSKVQSRLPPHQTSPAGCVPSISVCVRPSLSLVVDALVKRELGITMEVDEGSPPDEQAVGDQIFADVKNEVLDLHVKSEIAVQDAVPLSQQGIVQCYREYEEFKQDFAGVNEDLRELHENRVFDANMFVEKDLGQPLSSACLDGRVFKNVMVSQQREFVPFKEGYANVNESVIDLHVNRGVTEDVFMNRVPFDNFQDNIKVEGVDGMTTSANRDVVEFRANQTVDEAANNEVVPIVHRNYWEVEGLGRISGMNQGINLAYQDFIDVNHARRVQVDQNVVVVKQETQVRIQDAIQEIHKILMIQSKEVTQPKRNYTHLKYVFILLFHSRPNMLFLFVCLLFFSMDRCTETILNRLTVFSYNCCMILTR